MMALLQSLQALTNFKKNVISYYKSESKFLLPFSQSGAKQNIQKLDCPTIKWLEQQMTIFLKMGHSLKLIIVFKSYFILLSKYNKHHLTSIFVLLTEFFYNIKKRKSNFSCI